MTILIKYFISFFTTAIISFALIKKPLTVSIPNNRSLHNKHVPSSGGIAILFGLLIFIGEFSNNIMYALSFAAIIGFLDDKYSLSKMIRFLSQFIIALLIVSAHFEYSFITIFWIIFIIYFINMYNFMDGIDSLASLQSIFFISSLALLYGFIPSVIIPIIAFLFFNTSPAKIFLGNSGSYLLGALLSSYIFNMGYDFLFINELLIYLILLTIFFADATYTLARRFLYKYIQQNSTFLEAMHYVTEAHCTHNYQILAKKYNSHVEVVLMLMTYNIFWCFPLAYLVFDGNQDIGTSIIFFFLSYIPYVFWCYKNDSGLPREL